MVVDMAVEIVNVVDTEAAVVEVVENEEETPTAADRVIKFSFYVKLENKTSKCDYLPINLWAVYFCNLTFRN